MSNEVKRRRGTTAEHAAFTGAEGEITIDTDKATAVVHDGATAGGFPLAHEDHAHAIGDVEMATNRLLGRLTAGTGAVEALTGTQVTTMLDTFTSGLKGLAPASGGGTTNFLRADGSWAAPVAVVADGDKGDITVSASGATWTIDDGVVALAKLADMASASVFYRKTAGTGVPEVQSLATLKTDLGLTGTNSGDQTISLTGDVTGSGTGSFAATIANDAVTTAKILDSNVTLAKIANIATAKVLGRTTAGSGVIEELDITLFARYADSPANFTALLQYGGIEVGFRDIPWTTKNANYTLATTDRGCGLRKTDTNPYTWTVPLNATVAIPTNAAITVMNDGSSGAVTLAPEGGVTLQLSGTTTTGSRTLAAGGVATLLKVDTNKWHVSGAGVT